MIILLAILMWIMGMVAMEILIMGKDIIQTMEIMGMEMEKILNIRKYWDI